MRPYAMAARTRPVTERRFLLVNLHGDIEFSVPTRQTDDTETMHERTVMIVHNPRLRRGDGS